MYSYIYDSYEKNTIMYITIPILFISNLSILFFTFLDIYKFKYFEKYRINYNNKRKYPSTIEIKDGIQESFKAFFGIIIPVAFFGIYLMNIFNINLYNLDRNLPNIFVFMLEIFYIVFMTDVLFYFLHRLMHTKYFYKNLHKFHHTYKEPFALTNHYVHPLELLLFMIPPMIPPILLGSHITVMWCSIIILNWNGLLIHSGYNFNFLSIKFKYKNYNFEFPCIKEHDYHHKYFNYNFASTFPFMDQIMGTYYNE